MKFSSVFAPVALLFSAGAQAAKSFSASNLYYAAGLTSSQQDFFLGGLQDAGVKVLRVWLDGRSPHPMQHCQAAPLTIFL